MSVPCFLGQGNLSPSDCLLAAFCWNTVKKYSTYYLFNINIKKEQTVEVSRKLECNISFSLITISQLYYFLVGRLLNTQFSHLCSLSVISKSIFFEQNRIMLMKCLIKLFKSRYDSILISGRDKSCILLKVINVKITWKIPFAQKLLMLTSGW